MRTVGSSPPVLASALWLVLLSNASIMLVPLLLPRCCSAFGIVFQLHQRAVVDTFKKRPTTWLIDGNNFLGQRGAGTPQKGEALADRLRPIASQGADQVVLVFDGRPGDAVRTDILPSSPAAPTSAAVGPTTSFRHVQLEEGMIADDFIMEEIAAIGRQSKNHRVKLVTADKKLRAMALATRPTVKAVVNPKVFWKKYLPRMSGQKKNLQLQQQQRRGDDQEEEDEEEEDDDVLDEDDIVE